MLKLGLTGSIGMGKTETAKMFTALGIAVFDADAAVHELYARGGKAVALVETAFPGSTRDGAVDRDKLSGMVLSDPTALARLEAIVHPLVRETEAAFLAAAKADNADLVVLDIPLLFETAGEGRVDRIVVVSAPSEIQRARVMERPGMTDEKFKSILAKQVPDAEKRARAHYIIMTDKGLDDARAQVKRLVDSLRAAMAQTKRDG